MKNISLKVRIFIGTLIAVLAPAAIVYAALNTLNGQNGATQTFSNDTNVTMSSASNVHTLGWSGILPISRGGTGASSFESGTIPISDGTNLVGDFAKLSWNPGGGLDIGGGLTINSDLEIKGADFHLFNSGGDQLLAGLLGGPLQNQLRITGEGHNGPILDFTDPASGNNILTFPLQSGAFAVLEGSATSTIQIGDIKSCIVMADSDGSGVTYVTANDGVLVATTTQPSNCE